MNLLLEFICDFEAWKRAIAVRRLIKLCEQTECRDCAFSILSREGDEVCIFRSGCPTDWKAVINSIDFD